MRIATVVVILLLPVAGAVPLAEDATGDVIAYTNPGFGSQAPAGYQTLDLVSLAAEETKDAIIFRLGVDSLEPAAEPPVFGDGRYIIGFQHHDQLYLIIMYRAIADQAYRFGFLVKSDPDFSQFTFVRPFWNGEITEETAAGILQVVVQREDLVDTDGAAPFPGRDLDGIWALSNTRSSEGFLNLGLLSVGQQYGAFDRMPDRGNATTKLPITIGPQQSGAARLFSPAPMRASNGEATTFVYNLTATHSGEAGAYYEITTGSVPQRWTVTLPFDELFIRAGASVTFPILVTIPFAHQHGSVETMDVQINDRGDPNNVGRATIGIRFHETPQPAGHHDTMYIHSQRLGPETAYTPLLEQMFTSVGQSLYFNTLEEDPDDAGVAVNGQYQGWGCFNSCAEPEARWQWPIFLQPGLEMGLDFDLARRGTLHVEFDTDTPMPLTSLSGELMMWRFSPWTESWSRLTLAELVPTPYEDRNGAFAVDWEIKMKPVADLLPFRKLSYLGLMINASSQKPSLFTGAEAPQITGGHFQLPLNEYHDPVTDIFATTTDLMWMADVQERRLNAGEGIIFNATLHNTGSTGTFRLDLAGRNQDWASIYGLDQFVLSPDGKQDVQVVVQAPKGTADGERADIILSAISLDDPGQRALLRMVATVDSTVDHPDEVGSLKQTSSKGSPLPLVVALGAVLLALRRRL